MNNQIFPKTYRKMKFVHSSKMAQFLTNKCEFPIVWLGTRREAQNMFIFGYDDTPELRERIEEWKRMTEEANKMKEAMKNEE